MATTKHDHPTGAPLLDVTAYGALAPNSDRALFVRYEGADGRGKRKASSTYSDRLVNAYVLRMISVSSLLVG